MDYPIQVSTFTVTGKLAFGVADSDDPGLAPDLVPVHNARILFTPDLDPAIYRVPAASLTVFQEPVEATTNIDGAICGLVDGTPDVILPYGLDPDIEPSGWTWRVQITVEGFPVRDFHITGSAGGVVDLGGVVPVPPDPGGDIPAWEAVVAQAVSARDAAIAAAASVAPGQPNGTATLDSGAKLPEAQVPSRLSAPALATLISDALATYVELDADGLIPIDLLPALTAALIPDLDAAKTTTGVFARARIVAEYPLKTDLPASGAFVGQRARVTGDSAANTGEYRWNGTAWVLWESEWIAWTPTVTGLTAGAGAATGRYRVRNGVVRCELAIPITGAITISGDLTIGRPVTPADRIGEAYLQLGRATLNDTGTGSFVGAVLDWSGTTVAVRYLNASAMLLAVTATAPFTWANTDRIIAQFEYAV